MTPNSQMVPTLKILAFDHEAEIHVILGLLRLAVWRRGLRYKRHFSYNIYLVVSVVVFLTESYISR
jgi:hypothetical protein